MNDCLRKDPCDVVSNSDCHYYLLYKTDRSVIRIPYMVKANERTAVPNKQIQVPKGIAIRPIFAKQNTFKYNKKLLAWQRNSSWSSQLRRDKFVALVLGLGLGKISGEAIKCLIRYSPFI